MEIYLSCSCLKTSVLCEFPCLLSLSPTNLGRIVSFLLVSILTPTYEERFHIIARKLLRKCNLTDYTERWALGFWEGIKNLATKITTSVKTVEWDVFLLWGSYLLTLGLLKGKDCFLKLDLMIPSLNS